MIPGLPCYFANERVVVFFIGLRSLPEPVVDILIGSHRFPPGEKSWSTYCIERALEVL